MITIRKALLTVVLCLFSFNCFSQKGEIDDYKIYELLIQANLSPDIGHVAIIDSTENFGLENFSSENEDTTDFVMKRAQWKQAWNVQFDSLGYQALTNCYFYPTAAKKIKYTSLLKGHISLMTLSAFLKAKEAEKIESLIWMM